MYIHELQDWPRFRWSAETIAAPLASVRDRQSRLIRHMGDLGFNLQQEAVLRTLTSDARLDRTPRALCTGAGQPDP